MCSEGALLLLLCGATAFAPAAHGATAGSQLPLDEPLWASSSECNGKTADQLAWHDGALLGLRGRAFNSTATTYERLPATAQAGAGPGGKGPVRSAIWSLQKQPAGLFLQFTTDAPCIFVRYNIASPGIAMWHFPSTGVAGMDLYAWDEGNSTWRWTGTSHPKYPQTQSKMASFSCIHSACKPKTYRLHLPTYMATSNISIGVERTATIAPDSSHIGREKPIVWYGTSILQGGVASRPGQVNTHIVSRALETEIYNFGFSGNGIMELSVAQYLTEIDCSMIIVDCSHNMNAALITQNTIPLVRYLRTNGHASTPIVLAEGTPSGTDWSAASVNTTIQGPLSMALDAAYKTLLAGGDKHLYYAKSADMFADPLGMPAVNPPGDDPTVGGTHLTDLGMRKQAAFWAAAIPKFMTQTRQGLPPAAAAMERRPRQIGAARPLTSEETAAEHLRSEEALATMLKEEAAAGMPDGWGPITAAALGLPFTPHTTDQHSGLNAQGADHASAAVINGTRFVRGRPFPLAVRNHSFDRFPLSYAPSCPCHGGDECPCGLRNDVWALSQMSTGSYLRFATDAHEVTIAWTLREACAEHWFAGCHLWHMPDSGTNAFDTYAWDEQSKAWRHLPNALLHYAEQGHGTIIKPHNSPAGSTTTYIVYLPLRNAPKELSLSLAPISATICGGADTDCASDAAPQFKMPPVLWYGTSIQQGGVASRAGTAYDAVISRSLGREVINIGFANNGVMELSVAKLLSDIQQAAAIVIDCLPNMNAAQVTSRTGPLVKYLRAHGHASTPIVLAEGTPTPGDWLNASTTGVWSNEKNDALRSQYEALIKGGEAPDLLHYVSAAELFKTSLTNGVEGLYANPTVGGVHSSDLGQYEIADFYTHFLPAVIGATSTSN